MSTASELARLHPHVRELAWTMVNELANVGVQAEVRPLGGLRSWGDQYSLFLRGRSPTLRSFHIVGQAFDLDFVGWDRDLVPSAVWPIIGAFGEELGLRWGGRFRRRDVGHFEWGLIQL